jgi:hypothetical protein
LILLSAYGCSRCHRTKTITLSAGNLRLSTTLLQIPALVRCQVIFIAYLMPRPGPTGVGPALLQLLQIAESVTHIECIETHITGHTCHFYKHTSTYLLLV